MNFILLLSVFFILALFLIYILESKKTVTTSTQPSSTCPNGQHLINGNCITGCGSDSDCTNNPNGKKCSDTGECSCIDKTYCPPGSYCNVNSLCDIGECGTSIDCTGNVNGLSCITGNKCGCTNEATDCQSNQYCNNDGICTTGNCTPATEQTDCKTNSAGLACVNFMCGCNSKGDCAENEYCNEITHVCVVGECGVNTDCTNNTNGPDCLSNKCGCTIGGSDCGPGKYCNNGICEAGCSDNNDCESNTNGNTICMSNHKCGCLGSYTGCIVATQYCNGGTLM